MSERACRGRTETVCRRVPGAGAAAAAPPYLACGRVVRVSLPRLRSEGGIPPERSMKKPALWLGGWLLVVSDVPERVVDRHRRPVEV